MNNFIEDDEIVVDDISQLEIIDRGSFVEVNYKEKYIGICIIWYDLEQDESRYIPVNGDKEYLDNNKKIKITKNKI